ncbi:hypothetical protein BX616_006212 [Lobosporangium transversale]|nr:hypothetical protein BX616_006212 [Lobosporangium transversale]
MTTTTADDNNSTSPVATTMNASPPASTTSTGSGGLRRSSTLKAYLANKNKLKERQAINVIVDPTVLQRQKEESSSENEVTGSALSPISPAGAFATGTPLSPVSGRRIDADLEALDKEKKQIEDQLAIITQRLHQISPPSSPTIAPITTTDASIPSSISSLFASSSKEELQENKTRLCQELDVLLMKRRELLQSWTRDYKSLKRSGSLAKPKEDLFWVTTA